MTTFKSPIPLPPRALIEEVGGGDYRAVGFEMFYHLVTAAGLLPTSKVLDIGCGCGRIATPIVGYLDDGTYNGFDIQKEPINWCQTEITSRFPMARFQHISLYNERYNKQGEDAATFRFPYEDARFDVVVATSVFTHMLTEPADRYLAEIRRVLRDKGRAFLTFYLIDAMVVRENAVLQFGKSSDGMATANPDVPEEAVAFERAFAEQMFTNAGLLAVDISKGSWRGENGITFQDAVLLQKQDKLC